MAQIVLTKGVKEYRQTIPHYVSDQDTVLEIGCAWGTTSNLLYKSGKYVVAIDKGKSLALAKKEYPHIHFEQLDGFDISAVLRLGIKFNKVYIDISGCRKITTVIEMVIKYERVFDPEVIVVKSTKLKGFVSRCRTWNGENDGLAA